MPVINIANHDYNQKKSKNKSKKAKKKSHALPSKNYQFDFSTIQLLSHIHNKNFRLLSRETWFLCIFGTSSCFMLLIFKAEDYDNNNWNCLKRSFTLTQPKKKSMTKLMSLLLKHYSCWRTTLAFSHTMETLSLAPVKEDDMDLFGKTHWSHQQTFSWCELCVTL